MSRYHGLKVSRRAGDKIAGSGSLEVQSSQSRNSENLSYSASPPVDAGKTEYMNPYTYTPCSRSLLLRSKFSVVPDLEILRSAADVYFSSCQNQPYCYFHEETFRRRLGEGTLPTYLLLTFMATSARYSFDEFFEGRQFEAMDVYARAAWRDILKSAFSSDLDMDLYTVAATNMLAVVDFTGINLNKSWIFSNMC